MKRRTWHANVIGTILMLGFVAYALHGCAADRPDSIDAVPHAGRPARIHPDYSGVVAPPNIAPLNFVVQEDGRSYFVRIAPERGEAIEIASRTGKIVIPERPWRRLLDANAGGSVRVEICVQADDGTWTRFEPIVNRIATEPIDDVLVYRKLHPGAGAWGRIGIYQRDLRGFRESLVLDNRYFGNGCVNCHTFCNNRPDTMLLSTRSSEYGSAVLLIQDGDVRKVGTKFTYTTWHPSGKVAAYSVNAVSQFFHSSGHEVRDVVDLDSHLAYYVVDAGVSKTAPDIARKDRLETYPAWSPDGRYLYFCSAPLTWSQRNVIPKDYDQIKYDLMRISYDVERDEWGPLETVLAAEDTGRSILLPRISPDGRWLAFCMCDYGCFPVYRADSDLYVIDLEAAVQTGRYEYRPLAAANSEQSESWHSWSSNSRWLAFSSKRDSAPFTRTYLAYVDADGNAHKPVLLPQKDPTFYDSYLRTYSVPELATEPIRTTKETLARVIRGSESVTVIPPITMATPQAGTTPPQPWTTERE
ncbi:MAG: hypothetical protein QM570_18245 [Planctomycetota bacterium]|nr:hypothetical protein [Planctomycetota bacterium]